MATVFEWPVRVYIEDTDAGGIVYYANYLRFLERARTEWLRSFGLSQEQFRKDDILFVVRDVQLRYRTPARLDDELIVTVAIEQHRRVGVTLTQQVLRATAAGFEVIVEGRIELACINSDARPQAMPELFTQALHKLSADLTDAK